MEAKPVIDAPEHEYRGASHTATTNACKLCTPLGATLAFRGVEGAIPFLHGSQGCATYMRRYVISHFREPMDIASSSLGEKNAIYGGGPNLKKGLLNAMRKYGASVVGVATTCLTETIGDDVPRLVAEFRAEFGDLSLADIVHVSTPSYSGTHVDGFHAAVRALADQLCVEQTPPNGRVNLMPGFVSPADMRHLKELVHAFGLDSVMLPDYSETLDGPALLDYENIPSGGAPVARIRAMGGGLASVELGRAISAQPTAGTSLLERFGVPLYRLGLPMGLRETDAFFAALKEISGREAPRELALERGRYVDALVDGHKYVSGMRAVVYGEEDLCIGMTSFLAEIGVVPVLVATGAKNRNLAAHIEAACGGVLRQMPLVREGADFFDIVEEARTLSPDVLVGHSKGQRAAREWGVPLLRVGFPIHDRFGGQRVLHLGYRGAQQLFDRLVNMVLEKKQSDSDIGYGYL
ncbi:nitrogenase molybdenum-iron protein NifN [Humidesulfovibrio mexicanus]|uniref:Nitrogenase molybdenum-iron protein NifN n=1 Tax=Humidesulfovibrio mexicanus TaxID=147047 RepID=A0A239B2P0_9BACT|nr:nitrogenase component 1 [Humidesulfovibrio mexicanus]SNS02079.1 nitrogenase molybdenum-iron protein NifN [Humidesulfovibrio mexicanus]